MLLAIMFLFALNLLIKAEGAFHHVGRSEFEVVAPSNIYTSVSNSSLPLSEALVF